MTSNYDSKCIMLWEYIDQSTGQHDPNNQIRHSRSGASCEYPGPVQYFQNNAENVYTQLTQSVYKKCGSNMNLNYLVPAENTNVDSSVRIDIGATVDDNTRIDSDSKEDNNFRLNTETQKKVIKQQNPFLKPPKTELNEKDLQLIRDHLAGKIKLGVDFMRYIHNIPTPISRGEKKSDPSLILAKNHPWSSWVCNPYPKLKPKSNPKLQLPKSDGWATTWDEIRGGVIGPGPMTVDEGKSSETESEQFSSLLNNPEEPSKCSDDGIIVSIALDRLARIPEQRN